MQSTAPESNNEMLSTIDDRCGATTFLAPAIFAIGQMSATVDETYPNSNFAGPKRKQKGSKKRSLHRSSLQQDDGERRFKNFKETRLKKIESHRKKER